MHTPLAQQPGTLRPFLRLAWPIMAEQVLIMMVGLSDTLLVGWNLSQTHLAAMPSVGYLLWALQNVFSFVSIGATAMIARFVGAGDRESANRVVHQALLCGAALAAMATTLALVLRESLLVPMRLENETARLASRFFQILLPVLPALMLELVGIACLRGAGDMVTGLVTMMAVNVINIAVSWSLLLGLGPLPKLGWDGLAIGAVCGHSVGGLIPWIVLARGRVGLRLRASGLSPDVPMMRRILRIGVPGGTDLMSIIGCQLVFLSMVNRLGTVAQAAHGVAIRVESLAYLPGYAFQVAIGTLVGQHLGARNPRQAGRSVLVACLAASSMLLAAGIVFFFGADLLVGLFLDPEKAQVAHEAAALLRIVSLAMVPLANLMVLSGALRGAGDTRWPLAFTLIGMAGVRLPLAELLAHTWQLGVRGAWYAMVADLVVRWLLVSVRFFHGGWKRIEV